MQSIPSMAGAGEACSHRAALLYAVIAKANLMNETACTLVKCSWLQPISQCTGSKLGKANKRRQNQTYGTNTELAELQPPNSSKCHFQIQLTHP
ncbi:hypothetical protein EMCRGX_G005541 [Ephydatia muelleri]